MAKLTLNDLRALRESKKREMSQRDMEVKDTQVIVGMGTCGIAAGAKETFNTIMDELDQRGIHNVALKQTGCMGLCYSEPTVEVIVEGMPPVIYGKVNTDVARQIVALHIVEHKLLNDHIFDKPAADILK